MSRYLPMKSPARMASLKLLAGLLLVGGGVASAQQAASYPTKPVRIIVAAAPGGTSDILARTLGQEITKRWNQPIVVENRAGAESNLGAEVVAKSPGDGYTLLLLDVSTLTMGPSLHTKLNYNPRKDFKAVTMLVFSPHVLAVNPSLPVNNVRELIAYSKNNPQKLNFASASNASRLGAVQMNLQTGTDLMVVPYKGGSAALNAVAGGESNVILNGLLASLPLVKSGNLRGIAVASDRRMDAAPNLPTVSESGIPGFVTGSWQGVLAPASTPADIVKKINATVVDVLKMPEIHDKLVGLGADVIGNSPEEFERFLVEDTERWAKVVRDGNIKPSN